MSIINPGNSGRSNLSHLDALVSEKASAFKITDDGKLESSYAMAFRSGLNYLFGVGKSDEDAVDNRKTLEFVLGQIETGTSKSVRDALMNRTLKLGGDEDGAKFTVKDRLTRGTYVSSEMIRQLQCLATDIHQAEKANKATVDSFFGRPIYNTDVGGPQASAVSPSRSEQPCGFAQIVRQLQERGTKEFPREQTAFWKHVGEFLLDGGKLSEKGKSYLTESGLFRNIDLLVFNNSRAEKKIGDQDLKALAEKPVGSGVLLNALARDLNLAYMKGLGEEGLANAVCDWLKATNDTSGITQNDCDWLSCELASAAKSNRQLALPTENSVAGLFTSLFERLLPEQDRNPFTLLSEISSALDINGRKERLLPGAEKKIDTQLSSKDQLADMKNALHTKLINRMDVARLMGDSIKPILLARRQRINDIQTAEIEARSDKSKQLERNLAPYDALKEISAEWLSNRDNDPQYDRINRPTTASAFAREVLLRPILVAKHRQSKFEFEDVHGSERLTFDPSAVDQEANTTKPAALSGDNKRQVNEFQMRQMNSMRASVQQMEQGMVGLLDDTLPVLDRFSEFSRRLETCRLLPGGIAALGKQDLVGLEKEASALLDDAKNLDGIALMLGRKYLDVENGELKSFEGLYRDDIVAGLKPPVVALLKAVDTITTETQAVKRLVTDIQLKQLSADSEDFIASMKDMFAGPVSEPPMREAEEVQNQSTNPFAPENFPEGLSSVSTGPTQPSLSNVGSRPEGVAQSTNPFDRPDSQVVNEPPVRQAAEMRSPSTNPFDEENLAATQKSTENSTSTRPLDPGQSNVSPPQKGPTESTNPFDEPPRQGNYNPFG